MPAKPKPSRIPEHDLGGSTKADMARRAQFAGKFSPYGPEQFKHLPPEVKAEWHRKGAYAAQESRKRRKKLSDLMKSLLDQPADKKMMDVCGIVDMFPGVEPEEITYAMLLTMSVVGRGISTGRADQYTVIRDSIGEKPKDNLALTGGDGEPLNPPSVRVFFNEGTE